MVFVKPAQAVLHRPPKDTPAPRVAIAVFSDANQLSPINFTKPPPFFLTQGDVGKKKLHFTATAAETAALKVTLAVVPSILS